jgi:hypothetical protein
VPGTLHQGLLLVIQDDPWLAFDLLGIERPTEGVPIDRRGEIEREGAEPLSVRAAYPDLVLVYQDPDDPRKGVVISVEAKRAQDAEKRWMIPIYQACLAGHYRLPTYVVVIALDARVSRAMKEWAEGPPPKVDVLLLDVVSVSRTWLDEPEKRPMAAILAGILHGYHGDLDAARVAFRVTRSLGGKRGHRHGLTILAALTKEARNQLIAELPMDEQDTWMDVERRSGTYAFGREEGLEEGLEQGREEGRRLLVELILSNLGERRIPVDAHTEDRIRGCRELPTLQRWAGAATRVASAAELLDESS